MTWDDDGSLLVSRENGQIDRCMAGEITLLKTEPER